MIWRLGRYQMLATWKGTFTAVVGIPGGDAFTLLAAGRGFPGEWSAAKAIERLQQEQNHHEAYRSLGATPHAASGYQIDELGLSSEDGRMVR